MLEGEPLPRTTGNAKGTVPRQGQRQRAGAHGAGGVSRNMQSPVRTPQRSSWLQPEGTWRKHGPMHMLTSPCTMQQHWRRRPKFSRHQQPFRVFQLIYSINWKTLSGRIMTTSQC